MHEDRNGHDDDDSHRFRLSVEWPRFGGLDRLPSVLAAVVLVALVATKHAELTTEQVIMLATAWTGGVAMRRRTKNDAQEDPQTPGAPLNE